MTNLIELSTLKFSVDTSQLAAAKKAFEELAKAQENANKPTSKPSSGDGNKPARERVDLLKKLTDLSGDLAAGNSRWEASQLRAARVSGESLDAVGNKLKEIRKLTENNLGGNIGAMRSIEASFEQLTNRAKLAKDGIAATAEELKAFGRIPFQVQGQMQTKGLDPTGKDKPAFDAQVSSTQTNYLARAKEVAVLRNEEKQNITVTKQNAAAHGFLTQEMNRVDAVLKEMNSTFGLNAATQERGANAVAKYSTNLQRSGKSMEEQAKLLDVYRGKVSEVAKAEEIAAGKRLSRALAPQISDVAVSIAGGMPLHLVMLQQGLQIRDLAAQSRVGADVMKKSFRDASSEMVTSLVQTSKAMASLAFGTIADAGAAFVGFATKTTSVSSVLLKLSDTFPKMSSSILNLEKSLGAVVGGLFGLFAVAVALATVETVKLMSANIELTRTLSSTSGSFQASFSASNGYVDSLNRAGVSTRDAMSIMGEMAQAGGLVASQMLLVGKSAEDMQRYGGVAISDTVKSFSEMSKDPVKALTDLAIKSGDVNPLIVDMARKFVQQGEAAKASALGVTTLADVNAAQIERMKSDLGTLVTTYLAAKKLIMGLGDLLVPNTAKQDGERILSLKRIQVAAIDSNPLFLGTPAQKKDKLSSLQAEINSLSLILKQKERYAEYEQAELSNNSKLAKQKDINEKNRVDNLSKKEKGKLALEDLKRAFDLPGATMSKAGYAEKKKEIEDSMKDKGSAKSSNAAEAYGISLLEKRSDVYNKIEDQVKAISLTEKFIRDLQDDDKFKKMPKPDQIKFVAETRLEGGKRQYMADAARKLASDQEEDNKRLAELDKIAIEGVKNHRTTMEKLSQDLNTSLQLGKDSDFEASLVGKTDLVRAQLETEYNLNKDYAKALSDFKNSVLAIDKTKSPIFVEEENLKLQSIYEANVANIAKISEAKTRALSDQAVREKAANDIFKQGFVSMGDAIVDFALTGKNSFEDMIKSMIQDLLKLEMKMQMMKIYEGASSGGGIFANLVKLFMGGAASGAGSVPGGSGVSGNNRSAFVATKTYEGGGFTGNASRSGGVDGRGGFYAVMHPKETVIDHTIQRSTPTQSVSQNNTQVVVNNYTGSQVTKKESVDDRGNRRVEVTLGDMTAGEVQRNGSATQKSMGATFGMRPTLLSR